MPTVICGIDPGLRLTGYAVLQCAPPDWNVLDAGVCRLAQHRSLTARLVALEHDISAILSEHHPQIVAVEALYAHYKHPRTAILMGHARGVILMTAARLGIEVKSLAATRIKRYLTGNGHASKIQVQKAVQATLGLPTLPEPPDVADALAIALCCANQYRDSHGAVSYLSRERAAGEKSVPRQNQSRDREGAGI